MTVQQSSLPSAKGRVRGTLIKYGMLIVAILVPLIAAEVYLRKKSGPSHGTATRYVKLSEHPPGKDKTYTPVGYPPESGLVTKPYRLRADANGFLLPHNVSGPADAVIVFVGGSTTECIFIEERSRFPYLVGEKLTRAGGAKVLSLNSGISGNHSLDAINILINKIIPIEPQIVVMMHNINDLSTLLYGGGTYWNSLPTRSNIVAIDDDVTIAGFLRSLKDLTFPHVYKRVADAVRRGLQRLRTEEDSPIAVDEFAGARDKARDFESEGMAQLYRMNLVTFVRICKVRGIHPVLMTQASLMPPLAASSPAVSEDDVPRSASEPPQGFRMVFHHFNAIVREVGKSEDVTVIDLAAYVPVDSALFYDVVHYSRAGCELVSDRIAETLLPLIEISRP